VTVALLSTPRFAYFGGDYLNEWVADPPYVWLPSVMVLAALAGHLVIFRSLLGLRTRADSSGHAEQLVGGAEDRPAQALRVLQLCREEVAHGGSNVA
jgi:hypothetical protein